VRIEWLQEALTEEEISNGFCGPVRTWWRGKFVRMSLAQRLAVPAIGAGKHVLVCAPTGTGKTLCAFVGILSDLLERAGREALTDIVDTVYVSPLRALGADIRRNLLGPLGEIVGGGAVRVGLRTGDTAAKERAAMVKVPPHILVTTPESLALCLASAGMRQHLRGVRRIIVDELHSLAPNKRGVDLMLSVERLSDMVGRNGGGDPQRIGLSATIAPLEGMARYLVGGTPEATKAQGLQSLGLERACAIADASFNRRLELDVASIFGKSPFATTAAINRGVYDLLEAAIRAHRTTLVFTNVRSATERVTYALRKRFAAALERGEESTAAMIHPEQIQAHHSSLDRDLRHEIERRLKAGELRCVVCSTSLELGIDIGTIDRVILLNSPKGVARGLQRVGRSGHRLDGVACGTLVPTVPADLLEAVVTAEAMRRRAVDQVTWPRNCLDVLAQHLIGMALQEVPAGFDVEHAFEVVRRTACYADLTREQFDSVVRFVASDDLRDTAWVPAKLRRQGGTSIGEQAADARPPITAEGGCATMARPRLVPVSKGVGALYAQNVGTITQEGQVKVRLEGEGVIGTVEEAFAQLLKPGDRFVLGGRCVQFVSAKGMSIDVTLSSGLLPTVPRWFSGMMSMEPGLTARMREFRSRVRAIAPAGTGAITRMLQRQYRVSAEVAAVAAAYLHAQHRYAEIPVEGQLLVERVPDEEAIVLVFHTMIGRAANEALARAVAYRMSRRFGGTQSRARQEATGSRGADANSLGGATVVVDDYAFGIWIDATTAARRADRTLVRSLLSPAQFEEDLLAAVESSELFRAQFRYTAIRAHALLQNKFGRRRFIGQMQSYAGRLYAALKEHHPDHLLLTETRRTVMQDVLAGPTARHFLEALPAQGLRLLDLPTPSPFAFGLFTAGGHRRDTMQLADTADFLLAMYEKVQARMAAEPAAAQAELFS
jgi:ATP-dependent helicase Lhr and Lhr-like helicase